MHKSHFSDDDTSQLQMDIRRLHEKIALYEQQLKDQIDYVHIMERNFQLILNSRSWRVTSPFRWFKKLYIRIFLGLSLIPFAIEKLGFRELLVKSVKFFMKEGCSGLKLKLKHLALIRAESNVERMPVAISEDNPLPVPDEYTQWVLKFDTISDEAREDLQKNQLSFTQKPLISIIMPVYDPPIVFLEAAIQSVIKQIYPHWELCIADDKSKNPAVHKLLKKYAKLDKRIKIIFRKENGHISAASNSAFSLAAGEYIALLDHDDLIPEHALYWIVHAFNQHPNAALIYSDEDKINETDIRYDPYFKSDFNYELFLAQNMINHLTVYRKSLIDKIGGFRLGFEGSQDYDLALRAIEHTAWTNIIHIPKILYHWRAIAGSTAVSIDEKGYAVTAASKAIREHFKRTNIDATVEPAPQIPNFQRVRFSLPETKPLVSILIPTKDRADLLSKCISSIISKSSYPNYEIIIVDNGSKEQLTFDLFDQIRSQSIKIIHDNSPFNFSYLNNQAAALSKGSVLCLMNNDIEIITSDWIEEMLSFALRDDIGCVGARLWYPNNTLQHAGVITGVGGVAGHIHCHLPRNNLGYFGRAVLHQSLSVVTAACLMIRKKVFDAAEGLDEAIAVAFNDVDFCLRVKQLGYRNIWTPYAEMYHHESATRGYEDNPKKIKRFNKEIAFMQNRWGEQLLYDPAYNLNLTLKTVNMDLAWPPR